MLKSTIYLLVLLLVSVICIQTAFANNDLPDLSDFTKYPIQILDGETGEPMIGVTVRNITQNPKRDKGTVTDLDGKTELDNPGHRDLILVSYTGYGEQEFRFFAVRDNGGVINLFPVAEVLTAVEIVGRKGQKIEEVPYEIQRIMAKDIAAQNAQTSADVLANAGAYIQKSQMGGGSPILRGFEANRVLIVVDGVRMNNAIYRSGHLQNSITIDNSILEQAEIIYGPGALMYGSDALGGVIHYKTRDPKLHLTNNGFYRFKTNAYTRFSTANKEKTLHLDLDYGTDRWGSLTSITYADYGDLTAGSKRPDGYDDFGKRQFYIFRNEGIDEIRQNNDPNIQRGTAYSQIDIVQKVKFQPKEHLYFVLNAQYSTSSDIPRYDALQDTVGSARELKWAEWYYGPQQRILGSLKTKFEKAAGIFDKMTLITSFQRIDEDRLKRKFRKRYRTFNLEDVYVYAVTADFEKYIGGNELFTFSYGFDGNLNTVQSQAGRMNVNNGKVIYDELSRYPSGGSTMKSYAGYATFNWRNKKETLNFNIGGRFNNHELSFNYDRLADESIIDWPELYYDGLNISNRAMNWAIGLTYNSKDNWQFKAANSTAFRAPNLDDLAKVRPKNGKATVPNPDLQPELSLNYEVTLGKQIGALNKETRKGMYLLLSGTGFYTELTNAIVREKGTLPDGSTTIIIDGEPHEVQQNVNAGEAFVYGLSGNAEFNLNDQVLIQGSINMTTGRRLYNEIENGFVIDTLVPLDHIPPMYGRLGLIYKTEKLRMEALIRFNGAKPLNEYSVNNIDYEDREYIIDHEGTSDNIDYGLINQNPDADASIYEGLPAWMTYNFYMGYQFSRSFSINVGVENITDVHYRNFASGISAPGRNFSVTFRGSF